MLPSSSYSFKICEVLGFVLYIMECNNNAIVTVLICITNINQVVGVERGPLSLVSTTDELLDRKVAAPA
jgi:hypothetical protein